MEVPTLSEFKLLLKRDHVFRDYFNTFLSLPIFSRRVKYVVETESFEIDPRPQSQHNSDSEEVMSWLYTQRLPLFWNCHLLYEYALCLELSKSSDNGGSCCGLCGVKEMGQFRYFLSGTEGERSCQFWMDVQLLLQKLHTGQVQETHMARFIGHVRIHYISDGAPLGLNPDVKNKLIKEFCYLHRHTSGNHPHSSHSRQVQILVEAQKQAIVNLRAYWYKMYEDITRSSKHSFSKVEAKEMAEEERLSSSPSLPVIASGRRKSEFCQQFEKSTVKLPQINRRERKKRHLSTERLRRVATKPLFTPSTTTLFPLSHLHLNLSPPLMTCDIHHLAPFLTGSLRADFLAGSPLLSHISSHQKDSSSVNYLLFWWSAEVLFTLDEIRRWRNPVKNQLNRWGSPYSNELIPTATDPNELVQLFLRKGSPYSIELPPHTREALVQLLPRGLGQSLLLSVQEYAAQQLLQPWKEFLAHDDKVFMKHCTALKLMGGKKRKSLQSPVDIVESVYGDGCQLEGMWEALRLVEIAWCPATACLPSRSKPTNTTLSRETSDERNSFKNSSSIFVRLTDLIGISLDHPLTTVSDTMKRSFERSVNTVLSVTTPQHCSKPRGNQQTTKKKPIPGSLKEIVKDCEQLRVFREFLAAQGHGSEVQLLFWLAMEDLRETSTNSRACPRKMERIVKYFLKSSDTKKVLQCPDSLVDAEFGPSLTELLAFQSVVGEMIERRWFGRYIASLTVEESHSKEEECGDPEQSQSRKTPVCIEHTRDLWRTFAQGVISFRRGLMDLETAEDFKSYLREEVVRGSSGSHKKMVGTKVVYVTKLLNDLSFWAEVERYKDVADVVRAAKRGRSHTQEDEIMIYKKAHAIINCFIDSAVIPRVQVNIPNELVHYILDCASQGRISRGLFHEAALSIFSILIVYWRKYLAICHTHKKAEGGAPCSQPHPLSPPNYHTQQPPRLQKVATFELYPSDNHAYFIDVGPTLAFSLNDGLRWVQPSHLRQQFDLAPPSSLGNSSPTSTHLRPSRHGAHIRSHASRRLSNRFGGKGGMKSQTSLLPAASPAAVCTNLTISNTPPVTLKT